MLAGQSHGDVNISTAASLPYFPNLWEHALLFGPPPRPGWSLENEAEVRLMGFKQFAVPGVPTWQEAQQRPIYIAHNLARIDAGNPNFGSLSVVFSPTRSANLTLVCAADTGIYEMACNQSGGGSNHHPKGYWCPPPPRAPPPPAPLATTTPAPAPAPALRPRPARAPPSESSDSEPMRTADISRRGRRARACPRSD